jgi:drug/metabolite transporter (DMT)-like permease
VLISQVFRAVHTLRRYSILLVVAGAMLWGTDSLFRQPLSKGLSPVTIVCLEHLVLSAVMLPVLVRGRREILMLNRTEWIALTIIALGGSVAATSLFTFSIKYGNPSVTVLLQKSQPLFTVLLARSVLGERPGRRYWMCLLPAAAGGYLLSTPEWRAGLTPVHGHGASVLAAVGAATLWGASTVFGRYIVTRLPVLILTGLRFTLALPVLVGIYLLQPAAARELPSGAGPVMALIGMALIPGLAALVLYYKGLGSTSASLASIGELAFPLTAVTANWLVLDIRLAASQFVGAVLLVASVTAVTQLEGRAGGDRTAHGSETPANVAGP